MSRSQAILATKQVAASQQITAAAMNLLLDESEWTSSTETLSTKNIKVYEFNCKDQNARDIAEKAHAMLVHFHDIAKDSCYTSQSNVGKLLSITEDLQNGKGKLEVAPKLLDGFRQLIHCAPFLGLQKIDATVVKGGRGGK